MLKLSSIKFKINKIFYLASKNVKSSLKEVVLGYYFWILASFFIITLAKTFIFSNLLNIDAVEYFFYLSFFLAIWQFLNNCIVSSLNIFFRNQLPLNFQIKPLELITIKYTEYLIHFSIKLIIIIILNIFFNKINFLILIDNLLIFFFICYCLTIISSIVGVFYRDLVQFISSMMQISFFLTPILWLPILVKSYLIQFLKYNPFYYIINYFYEGFQFLQIKNENFSLIIFSLFFLILINMFCIKKLKAIYKFS